jgi:hypothetical protein
MKLDDIEELWSKDSEIDSTELGNEATKIPKLHHKYYQIFIKERMLLRSYEAEMKKLKLDKYEFYSQGHNEYTKEKGWDLPARGMIIKTDIPMHLDADKDIISLSLKIGMQFEKVEYLESIIKSLTNRGYLIKSHIDWARFTAGG